MPAVPPRRVGNLPVEVTSFVGRRRELTEAKRLLSQTRLLTLTGVGGVGKTRLALRVAAELHRAFPDGVWLVDLASLEDPKLLPDTVATALDVSDQSARSSLEVLSAYLQDKRALLVLDNCEHLLDECATLVDTLLQTGPELRILATSRQALGVDGEWTLSVPPLSVPDLSRNQSASTLRQYDAVNLFAERAAAVLPSFRIDDRNAAAVARLCRRLEGIPLAIELAAVRLRSLSVHQILDRLDDRFQLLTGGSRTALPRQRTLRALIDWSFDLCSPEEQALWARLSIFSGGFDLDAAEAVCSDGELPPEKIFDLVAGLIDKSVLVREENGSRVRYRLLETVRQYGRERLAEIGGETELRQRHCDWYRRLAEQAGAEWFGERQADWYAWLQAELPNIRIALDFSLEARYEPRAATAIAVALGMHWLGSGRLREGRHWLARALQADPEASPLRAKALWQAGKLAYFCADMAESLAWYQELSLLVATLDDPAARAYLTHFEALVALFKGDFARSVACYDEACERYRAIGDAAGVAIARSESILPASLAGDERVRALYEESLALCSAAGDRLVRSWAMWVKSSDACRRGDVREAAALARESLELKRPFNDRVGIGLCLETAAWVAAAQGQGERAARLLGVLYATVWREIDPSAADFRDRMTLHSETEAKTRRLLGDRAFPAAFAEGTRFTLEQAVAYALEETVEFASPSRPASSAALTRREMQIAELVAQGLSNKEIAAQLVIAQRTAETHVEHILRKLGFTSRTQIAAWVTERRAAPESS
ncbi:hypothetical protein TH66_20330 [Carbonactinospora thermoautotrophica]|uniref:HTH luxR-type domain-containing protein n=1 Tax=Carbonactinospora thermoautotrophica TaxID=1469144 RepID=A0A132NDE4_9ACTN|nr:hypothetical protein TH66_20330 [Carbonactinospora thermoautotrophica]KWX08114.1 hypothetical protein TR74_16440 [Carbonactinospora thermoautotrophica]